MSKRDPSDLFIDSTKAVVKRTYVVNEADYDLVASIFPERTFATYFPGLCVRLLAETLRAKKITSLAERVVDGDVATPAALALRLREALEVTFSYAARSNTNTKNPPAE